MLLDMTLSTEISSENFKIPPVFTSRNPMMMPSLKAVRQNFWKFFFFRFFEACTDILHAQAPLDEQGILLDNRRVRAAAEHFAPALFQTT